MASDSPRTRRADRYAATPERVTQAAERMQTEARQRVSSGPVSPDPRTQQGYPPPWSQGPQQPPQGYGRQMPPYSGTQNSQPYAGQPYAQQSYAQPPYTDQQYAQQYAQQQYVQQQYAQQQYAAQQYAAQQQYAREQERIRAQTTAERERISSETSSHGAFRGYNTGGVPAAEKETPPAPASRGHLLAVVSFVILALAILTGGIAAGMSLYRTKQIQDAVRPYDNLFCEGVYVDGIHLGGMTQEQAMNSVSSRIQQRNDAWKVQLTYQGETVAEIDANMLGMSVDVGQIMNEAWAQGHTGDDEARYAAMQALKENPYQAYTAVPSGDTSVIDSLLADLKSRIEKPAKDAELTAFDPDQASPFVFSAEEYGTRLDTVSVRDELYQMVATMTGGKVELTPEILEPAVKLEDLQKHYSQRSSVYTPISTSSPPERNDNIRRAFELLNGYVLLPGNQFSFNTVVGERTEANGFQPAIEYAYGEHVMGIGGGVCQASTTIYQAAVCAGLSIVSRKPHSDSVSYTEYGKDATVYWNGKRKIDLVFKNNTDGPIYIVAGVQKDPGNGKRLIAKVTMYGEDMGEIRYEMESVITKELDPPEEPEYIKDRNATYVTYTDQKESVSKAKKGYEVESYRVEYVGNVVNARVRLYVDTYEPKAEKIYVGVTRRGDN